MSKKPKADRMHDHVYDSCISHSDRTAASCDTEAWAVVNRWKDKQKEHQDKKATPESKK